MNFSKVQNHICHITTAHPAFDIRIFYKAAKTLSQVGYDVTLIAPHSKNETVDGIKIFALSKPKNRLSRMLGTNWKAFHLALKQKAEVNHFHDPEFIPFGLLLKFIFRTKIIYDVHEDYPKGIFSKEWIPIKLKKPVSCIINWLEKAVSQKFDYIITATPSIKKNFIKNKVTAVRNFPITKNLVSSFPSSKNKPDKAYFSIIYVGNISEINGITQTIQAFEYLNSNLKIRFKLLGKFSPDDYKSEIAQLKGFKRINYLGFVPQKEIPLYLAQADAGIICAPPDPNSTESEPNKLFEYMLAGLPVIVSNFPLWIKFVKENNCGICVDPLNPREIAKAMEYLTIHPEEARKMGEYGRKAVLTKYNWENESKKLLKVYDQLLMQ